MSRLPLDYDETMQHLRARAGRAVTVAAGAASADGPPVVIELSGFLAEGEKPGSFVVDGHPFHLDATSFRGARASGNYLLVILGDLALEVNGLPDEPRFDRQRDPEL